jgi:polysaccharide lyase-like protein/thrombospondin type 3 repeat protein
MRRFLFAFLVLLLLPASAQADTTTVATDGDAFATRSAPAGVNGASANLRVRLDAAIEQESYIEFPSPAIPAGSTNVSAKLRVYAHEVSGKLVQAHTTDDFSEATLNWSNKPALGPVTSSQTVSTVGWKTFDVPVDGHGRNEYALTTSTNAARNSAFSSKESTILNDPQLVVTYSPPGDADGDGVPGASDNCPNVSNANQSNVDGDAFGDACDSQDNRDADGDGVQNHADQCPNEAGPNIGCPAPVQPSTSCGSTTQFRGTFADAIVPPFLNIQAVAGRVTRVTNPVAEGSHAGRFEVRHGDVAAGGNRAEVTVTHYNNSGANRSFQLGEEPWVCQWIYIPDGTATSSGWRILSQPSLNGVSSPPVAVFLNTGPLAFRVGHGNSSTTDWVSAPIQRNRWYHLKVRMRLGTSASTGWVEVYLDGVQQTLTGGVTRRARATYENGRAYTKAGLYRSNAITQTDVVYLDDIVIGH